MRLFPADTVEQFLADGWWQATDWDTSLRTFAADCPDRLALVDPPNREALDRGSPERFTWRELNEEGGEPRGRRR